ncbi:DeoR/GlpR family DNA-binding transcription regulator [Amphibacillus sediminis]|uniref:DeoR/GlpR family DNA-binding transcription regulator n=1 Tax=Amphibacillus sediminis TaxID=360185 RepID=UPI00082A7775|nr:DeoR/GlpR family DNA-binding transcription regulator [Amphibacillus sediminis]
MFAKEREEKIKNEIYRKGTVYVAELARKFNVSAPTIRSDLDKIMASSDDFERTHGGIIYKKKEEENKEKILMYNIRASINKKEKEEIAQVAISLVNERDTLLLDSSSTCFEFASLLAHPSYTNRNTILTNGLSTAMILKQNPNLTVIILGGIARTDSNTIHDEFQDPILNRFNIDKYFFSASGLSIESGFSEFNIEEVKTKRENLQRAKLKIALIDHTKFDQDSSSTFGSLDHANMLISDSRLDKEIQKKYAALIPLQTYGQ